MSILLLSFIALSSLFSFLAKKDPKLYFNLSKLTLSLACLISILALLTPLFSGNTFNLNVLEYAELQLGISFKLDTLAALMLSVVTLISLIICQYAVRYLESDLTRPRFLGQLGLITLSVSILVLSNNLLTAFIGWQFIGLSLYVTLNHYHYDALANRSAKKNFIINRIGDLSFLTAVVLCYQLYGTSSFSTILYQNNNELIGFLVFIAIMTKSAQFPFHVWLPDTMEAPTPVSALMHAGVINAGGYLLARLAPMYLENISLLLFVFIIGLITAALGSLFSFFQYDTKKKLAYSTMSQMGYMILQCGAGAFLSAIYHLIAHGFFKASLFLNAGDTLKIKKLTSQESHKPITAIIVSAIFLCIADITIARLNAHFPVVIWGFIFITLLQLNYKVLSSNSPLKNNIIALGSVFITLIIYSIIISYLNYLIPNLEGENSYFKVFQVSVVFIAICIQLSSWFIPSIKSPASKNKLIEQLFIRKFYIEELYRGSVLQIVRKLGDHFTKRPASNNSFSYKHSVLIVSTLTFVAGLVFSSTGQDQSKIINVVVISIFLLILIVTSVSANRANKLAVIFYWLGIFEFAFVGLALFTDSIAIQKVAFYHLVNILPLIGIMFLLANMGSNRKSLKANQNKLSWHKFYVGVLLILMLGVPGTATFVTEIYILSGLIAMNPILGFIYAVGIILLSIAILHCLQLYVFNRNKVYHQSPQPSYVTHLVCWIVISLNIFSGIFPSLILSIFSKI
ncbi:MAG: NADH:ubiquinone oxidoreductase subunit 5 (subunit L)/multisubunit Na+/H+ antiporter MnhA subunit [Francisellaceae bacterium]|jgi:NADH:ubiquinone oxidoreductase subunit 5 (subunit L)/multisubunit Na+/H+ antiporter MnhA subunit